MARRPAAPAEPLELAGDQAGPVDQELEQLARAADQLDAGDQVDQLAGSSDEPAAPAGLSNVDAVGFFLETARELLVALLKVESPKKTLAPDKVRLVAEAVGPVADKYGIQLGGLLGGYELELRAALVAGPVLLGAWSALRQELYVRADAKERSRIAAAAGQAPAPAPAPSSGIERAAAVPFDPDARKPWNPDEALANMTSGAAAAPPK